MNTKNNLLKVKDVAAFLQVGEMTVYRYIKSGRLKAIALPGSYRIDRAALDAFIGTATREAHQ